MLSLIPIHPIALLSFLYAMALAGVFLLDRKEFNRRPEKSQRYAALPLLYKLACPLIVVPLFVGTLLQPALFIVAVLAYFGVEAACIRWYRRKGLL